MWHPNSKSGTRADPATADTTEWERWLCPAQAAPQGPPHPQWPGQPPETGLPREPVWGIPPGRAPCLQAQPRWGGQRRWEHWSSPRSPGDTINTSTGNVYQLSCFISYLGLCRSRIVLVRGQRRNAQGGGHRIPTVCFLPDGPWPLGQEAASSQHWSAERGGDRQLVRVNRALDEAWKFPGSMLSAVFITVWEWLLFLMLVTVLICKLDEIICWW